MRFAAKYMIFITTLLGLLSGASVAGYAQTSTKNGSEKTTTTEKSQPTQPKGKTAKSESRKTTKVEAGKVTKSETSKVQMAQVDLSKIENKVVMEFIVENGDTIFIDEIRASKVYSRLPKQKGKEWRKYYRLVHNFSKAYPYALVAKKLVMEADSTIAADNLKGVKRDKYITQVQEELFEVFEGQMRSLTVSQGALIMKLIDREVGKSSYNLIKGYKSGITAGFWQGIAKIFGSDLKAPYDPEGEDALTEELVQIWEAGDFDVFYFSIFWKEPPVLPIPEKYL